MVLKISKNCLESFWTLGEEFGLMCRELDYCVTPVEWVGREADMFWWSVSSHIAQFDSGWNIGPIGLVYIIIH